MAHILVMPRQGNTVESCILVSWKVREGDQVEEDTTICDVETDKATFEVPAGAAGTVLKLLYPEGEDIPVLLPIAVIGEAGEDWESQLPKDSAPSESRSAPAETPTAETPTAEAPAAAPVAETPVAETPIPETAVAEAPVPEASAAAASPASLARVETEISAAAPAVHSEAAAAYIANVSISPRARRLAAEQAANLTEIPGTGPGERRIERDVKAYLESRAPLTAAAKAAVAGGAQAPIVGAGVGGRVTLEQLRSAAQPAARTAEPEAQPAKPDISTPIADDSPGGFEDTPIKGIRKLIAERMLESLATTAQFTLTGAADAARLQDLRARFKASAPEMGFNGVTINDLLLFVVARTLPLHPELNAHKNGDTLRRFRDVHLGVATDTPRGLMVPVIKNADRLSVAQIAAESKRLSEACRNNTINPDELAGSTFTVTNLGALGVESFTPVVNIPEVAILGVGGIAPRPVLDSSQSCGARFIPHIGLSLTINHQVVDGYPAAKFMKALRKAIAEIDLWLMR